MSTDQNAARLQQPVIRPFPHSDGGEWECQCARCGSSADWRECEECDDGYVEDDWGDDVVPEMHTVPCQFCRGHGGDYWCMSSREYCEANPLPGRESVERGKIEWFRVRASVG